MTGFRSRTLGITVRVEEALHVARKGRPDADYHEAMQRLQSHGLVLGKKYRSHHFEHVVERHCVAALNALTAQSMNRLVPSLGIPADLVLCVWWCQHRRAAVLTIRVVAVGWGWVLGGRWWGVVRRAPFARGAFVWTEASRRRAGGIDSPRLVISPRPSDPGVTCSSPWIGGQRWRCLRRR